MKTTEVNNGQDIIDSRDVIARIEELESTLEGVYESRSPDVADFDEWLKGVPGDEGDEYADDANELLALRALAEEAEGYCSDWKHGEALIRDSYFEDYARELAEDIGAINSDAKWPNDCIDWERAARELQTDYTAVDFDGVTYWTR